MKGYKYIAVFEFIKGLGALIVGVGIFELFKERKIFLLNDFISHAQLPSFRHFLERGITHSGLLLAFGVLYASFRFVEGYGLWKKKKWGRKVGIWSASLYLPFEFIEIVKDFTVMKVLITLFNIGLVIYLGKSPAHAGDGEVKKGFR